MASISKITIDGFKAFPNRFEDINLEGKNLLLYGENGSGKSSIYYALHCLLQSQVVDKSAIYFDPNASESLVNKDTNKNDACVEIQFTGSDVKYRISHNGYEETPKPPISILRELNSDCVFINHKFLFHFFSFSNSQFIDLFPVFIKDILPFILTKDESLFISQIYTEVKKGVERKGTRITKDYIQKIGKFNDELQKVIKRVNSDKPESASTIYNKYFRDNEDRQLKVSLLYDNNIDDIPKDNTSYWLRLGYRYQQVVVAGYLTKEIVGNKKELLNPVICLRIEEKQEDGTWKFIEKPQSYFNEAKLTAIALSIRFSLIDTANAIDGSFMALDDMLISLDMSNRMKVIDFLMKVILPQYKLYIFTHDKLLYASLKKRIQITNQQNDWLFGSIYLHDRDNSIDFRKCNPYPIFIEDHDSVLKAREYYVIHDYPACGQQLRKWCEDILSRLYPDTLLKVIDNRTGKTSDNILNDRIGFLKEFCKNESIEYSDFMNLKIYKDNILNAVSHYDVSSPIYGTEILSIMKILAKLDQLANGFKTIKVNHNLGIELTTDNGDLVTICIDIRSNKLRILEYQGSYQISFYTKCIVNKIIYNGIHIELDAEAYNSIYEAYWYYIGFYGCDSSINLLDILQDHGTFVRSYL